jgi:hypothetical protein
MGNAEDGARDRRWRCSAVVAGEIARAQSEANVDDDAGALKRELESESQNGNPSAMALIGSVSQSGSSAALIV